VREEDLRFGRGGSRVHCRDCHGFFPDGATRVVAVIAEGNHTREEAHVVGVVNRLTADQIAALAPGDTVTIESGAEFGRSRHTTGTVVRVGPAHVVVSCSGPRGGRFIEQYRRRDGVREGGGRAELVDADVDDPAARDLLRRRTQRIDRLYRQWSRRRADVDALRELQDAISAYLDEALTS
jgi:hypothetical protein